MGEVYDLIVFIPRGMIPFVIPEIPFSADFDVFPREFLPDPMESGVGYHFHGQFPLFWIYLLFQERVDPKGVHVGVLHRCHVVGAGFRAQQVG